MKKLFLCAALLLAATPAFATLKVGDKAPDFTAPATLGGKEFTFHLADALKKGPVVVYFYPPPSPRAAPLRRMILPSPCSNTRRWAPA
jgi:peroxiredoxin